MDIIRYLVRINILPFIKKWNLINFLLGSIDILSIALAFQCSYYINYSDKGGNFFMEKNFLVLFVVVLLIWLLILYLIKNTEIPRTKRYRVMFFEYLQSAVVVLGFLIILFLIIKIYPVSWLFPVEFTLFGLVFLFAVRLLEYEVFKTYRAKGYNQVNVVLIADDTSIPFIESLLLRKEWGYRIVAIFCGSNRLFKRYEKSILLIPEENLTALNNLMEERTVDEVLYLKSKVVPSEVRNVISSCEELGVIFRLADIDDTNNLTNAIRTNIANKNFLYFSNTPNNPYGLAIKKIMDITLPLIMIILFSWVFVIISVLVKFTSRGPIIYKQVRIGLRGRKFNLYKFRTMIYNADLLKKELDSVNEADGPAFKIKNDPRITKVGKFLRRTGLDELPQLFNILKGEMSLIGPRPPVLSETRQYQRWQLRRLSVKPGLSCFWQIKPDRNNMKFQKWMELDLAYIDNWSLRLDIIIFLKTIKTVFQRSGL